METSTTTTKSDTHKDVYEIITGKIIEHLKKGTVPWRTPWMDAGIPTSLISKRQFRGLNVLLLAALGYERNLFLTHKQLENIGGSAKKDEKPHIAVFWSTAQQGGGNNGKQSVDKPGKLAYYQVYNIAQCTGIDPATVPAVIHQPDPIKACELIVVSATMGANIRYKDPTAYYDPLDNSINVPKIKSFERPASFYSALFHQIAHSTGHFSKLDRMGLIQMSEYGCDGHTLEELVAEIVTTHLENLAGIPCSFTPDSEYLEGWIKKFKADRYFIFNACTLAQKAIDFILNIKTEDKEQSEE